MDWYEAKYYAVSPGVDPRGPQKGSFRVLRGGYWGSYAPFCRSAYRYYNGPGYRNHGNGLRACAVAESGR